MIKLIDVKSTDGWDSVRIKAKLQGSLNEFNKAELYVDEFENGVTDWTTVFELKAADTPCCGQVTVGHFWSECNVLNHKMLSLADEKRIVELIHKEIVHSSGILFQMEFASLNSYYKSEWKYQKGKWKGGVYDYGRVMHHLLGSFGWKKGPQWVNRNTYNVCQQIYFIKHMTCKKDNTQW